MNIEDEKRIYNSIEVSNLTGETESYDNAFFPKIIRQKEFDLIHKLLTAYQPNLILDYGCGGGWLSLLMKKWGFNSVGMDVSKKMLKTAKVACPNSDFILCDATCLPFINSVFDFITGISILHHLDFGKSVVELKRVAAPFCRYLFMEPSLLNPISALGRRLFPMDAHTPGEKPFTPTNFRNALKMAGFELEIFFTNFFISFPLARLAKITGLNPPSFFITLTYFFETLMETLPGFNHLNANIVTLSKIRV